MAKKKKRKEEKKTSSGYKTELIGVILIAASIIGICEFRYEWTISVRIKLWLK